MTGQQAAALEPFLWQPIEQNFVIGVGPLWEADMPMCDKCEELDKKIEHYRNLMARVADPQTQEGVGKLIEEMQAQKAALHPEREAD